MSLVSVPWLGVYLSSQFPDLITPAYLSREYEKGRADKKAVA